MYESFSADGVVITTDHDPHQSTRGVHYEKENGGAWCVGNSTMPVMHHVTDLPGAPQVPEAVNTVTAIIAADKAKIDMQGKPSFYFLRNILQVCKCG